MNNVIPFDFNQHAVRVIQDEGGEYLFVAKDIAEILEYSDTEAMTRRLDADEIQNRRIVGFGNRGVSLINEPGLYSAILGSNKPESKRFKKWVTSEVLPSIRKTGGYSASGLSDKTQATMIMIESISKTLNLPESGKLLMYQSAQEQLSLPGVVPAYGIDSGAITSGSSRETRSATDLLKEHGSGISAKRFNPICIAAGFLEIKTRRSTSSANGTKQFKSVSEAGTKYGKNVTNPNNQRETQPHWFVDTFSELLDVLGISALV